MALVKAQCTECGATIEVNPSATNLMCRYCGSNFVVEKAIKNYNINLNNSSVTNNFAGANVTIVNNAPVQPQVQYRDITIFWNKKFRDLGCTMTIFCDGATFYQSKKSFRITLQISTGPHVFTALLSDGLINQKTNILHAKPGNNSLVIEFYNHIFEAPEIIFR